MTPHHDNYATLTELFTTADAIGSDVAEVSSPVIVVPPMPRIECLVPGHLPVRAGVWFLPCARQLAGAENSGVLMQMETSQADVTTFGTRAAEGNRTAVLDSLAQQSRRWFVLPSHETSPADVATLGADRITLMTGADQAAVVAAYQTIKSIVSGSGQEASRLDLGLFIVGSSEAMAEETAGRLMHTVQRQLGFDLKLRGSMQQVGMVEGGLHRVRLDATKGPIGLIADIRRAISAAAVSTPEQMPPLAVSPPLSVAAVAPLEPLEAELDNPVPTSVAESAPAIDVDMVDAEDSLARCVDGLSLLPVRCPSHPAVELAVDAKGALHSLAMADALHEVLAVQAWSRSHASLLALACPAAGIDIECDPVVHMCTDDARAVTGLIDTEIVLHVLVMVEVGGRSVRCCTPLS